MPAIKIDNKTCTKCGLCIEDCPKSIYQLYQKGDFPSVVNEDTCIQCGHCLAVCKTDSIRFDPLPDLELIEYLKNTNESMESVFYSMRSTRRYKNENLSSEVLKKIVLHSSQAPAASNKRNVEIIIISNKELIDQTEKAVIHHFKQILKLINPFVRFFISLFSSSLDSYIKENVISLKSLVNNYEKGLNPVFRNTPYLAVFISPTSNRMSKDNVDGAVHYFRIAAHSAGLGSCIIGYAGLAHKSIEKYLQIPKDKRIFAVLTFGIPKYRYDKKIIKRAYLYSIQDSMLLNK